MGPHRHNPNRLQLSVTAVASGQFTRGEGDYIESFWSHMPHCRTAVGGARRGMHVSWFPMHDLGMVRWRTCLVTSTSLQQN